MNCIFSIADNDQAAYIAQMQILRELWVYVRLCARAPNAYSTDKRMHMQIPHTPCAHRNVQMRMVLRTCGRYLRIATCVWYC